MPENMSKASSDAVVALKTVRETVDKATSQLGEALIMSALYDAERAAIHPAIVSSVAQLRAEAASISSRISALVGHIQGEPSGTTPGEPLAAYYSPRGRIIG